MNTPATCTAITIVDAAIAMNAASEIIAFYQSTQLLTPAQLGPIFVKQWMDSPPHRAIVLGQAFDSSELGMGCAHGRGSTGLNVVLCVGVAGRP